MSKFTNPLNNIKIASPCSADWNAMIGNERKRFCGECKLNVYNLSGLSQTEAENLLLDSEGRLCVRFFRRADGTILTKDCPVGWRAVTQRVSKLATAFTSLVFAALSGVGFANYFAKISEPQSIGGIYVNADDINQSENEIENSNVAIQEKTIPVMGNVSLPQNERYNLGRGEISNLDEIRTEIKHQRRR